ncbi:MAG: hypothetical protein IPH62_00830 [Ignavibacteriae bacterium]|nr:hypothetical protein [Ignavibacteriota bacterium]
MSKEFPSEFIYFLLNLIFTIVVIFLTKFISENLIITFFISIFLFLIASAYLIKYKKYPYYLLILYCGIIFTSFIIEKQFTGFEIVFEDDTRVHIGDVDMSNFIPNKPDSTFYTWNFRLTDDPEEAIGMIIAKHVDPVVENGPVLMLVNKKPFSFLNEIANYPPEKEMFETYSDFSFDIPASFLIKGNNTFTIASLFTKEMGYDDINIKFIKISVRY